MSFKDEVIDTCRWYRALKVARITEGAKDEPAFRGRLMNDQTGAGQGAGTLLMFDIRVVPAQATEMAYTDSPVPFLLDRAKENKGVAFVLVHRGDRVFVMTDVRALALGRYVQIDALHKGIRHDFGKWDFLPFVLRKYGLDPIFKVSL